LIHSEFKKTRVAAQSIGAAEEEAEEGRESAINTVQGDLGFLY